MIGGVHSKENGSELRQVNSVETRPEKVRIQPCVVVSPNKESDFSGKAQAGTAYNGVLFFFLERLASLPARSSRRERSDSLNPFTAVRTSIRNRASVFS